MLLEDRAVETASIQTKQAGRRLKNGYNYVIFFTPRRRTSFV
jgi:hypothetical protein